MFIISVGRRYHIHLGKNKLNRLEAGAFQSVLEQIMAETAEDNSNSSENIPKKCLTLGSMRPLLGELSALTCLCVCRVVRFLKKSLSVGENFENYDYIGDYNVEIH